MNHAERTTQFSPDRAHRYSLWRGLGSDSVTKPFLMVIGLNPSTADEVKNDPTIRRCIAFAKAWGFGALCMTNLFAYRATKPEAMKAACDPIGEENNAFLGALARNSGLILAAWGVHGSFRNRDREVCTLIESIAPAKLQCLGVTKDGFPRHPLYVRGDVKPLPFAIHPTGARLNPHPAFCSCRGCRRKINPFS